MIFPYRNPPDSLILPCSIGSVRSYHQRSGDFRTKTQQETRKPIDAYDRVNDDKVRIAGQLDGALLNVVRMVDLIGSTTGRYLF